MKTIRQSYFMKAKTELVYDAFINPVIAAKWSGAAAVVSGEVGFAWSLWEGSIVGNNLEMVPGQRIVQEWKEEKWTAYSKVRFTLSTEGDGTRVDLLHEFVPDASAQSIEEGWKTYYLGPMQALFE